MAARGRRLNRDPKLVEGIRKLRRLLPGDDRFGDPLSTSGTVVGQRIGELAAERPSVLGEAGLGALQVWEALSEAAGRGRGDRDLAILFTDLVDFSDWAWRRATTRLWTSCVDVGRGDRAAGRAPTPGRS